MGVAFDANLDRRRPRFMKSNHTVTKKKSILRKVAWGALVAMAAGRAAIQPSEAATNVVLWDTSSHLADRVDLADKAGWKVVPTDLLTLEANPPKASSDPGYYGREYLFQGDAVVENHSLTA